MDKMDQLLNIVTWLATEVKNMKQEIAEVKAWAIVPQQPEVIEPTGWAIEVQRPTPYKVIPIESIIPDEWYLDPGHQWMMKKIYRWTWITFKTKAEAVEYLNRMQQRNPGQQYDIFPV